MLDGVMLDNSIGNSVGDSISVGIAVGSVWKKYALKLHTA
jgi:hypothetical protein